VQDIDFHIVQLREPGARASNIFREWVVDDIGGALSVVDEQRQIRRLTKVCYSAGFGDGCARELWFHDQVEIGTGIDVLLSGLGFGYS